MLPEPTSTSLKYPVCKVHGANMGPTWVLSVPDGPHVGPMNLTIRVSSVAFKWEHFHNPYATILYDEFEIVLLEF